MDREEFRQSVLDRDGHACVSCGEAVNLDVHHIVDRSLFPDGGYELDNGVTLCQFCHLMAERTAIDCDTLRSRAGIERVVLPPHFPTDETFDKWGNIVNADGTRLKGELFFEPNVQRVLADRLDLFLPYVKHPRTMHLPWSNPSEDDKIIESLDGFQGQDVVVSVKLDGEQSSCYNDRFHCRSTESATGDDRSRVKAIWGSIAHEIPDGWRICGENMYAKHSIHYHHLRAWFHVFGVWNERNECLSWAETLEWCDLLGLEPVPVIYSGPWDPTTIQNLQYESHGGDPMEGYVVRVARSFTYAEHRRVVAKYVRANHVSTDRHWRHQAIVPNELESEQ